MQVAKTQIYPVMCRFPLFAALCDHNPPTLQTDGQTERRHARKISTTPMLHVEIQNYGRPINSPCITQAQSPLVRFVVNNLQIEPMESEHEPGRAAFRVIVKLQ